MKTEGSKVCTSFEEKSYLCWCLESLGLEISVRDGVLKMTRDSMVVLKGADAITYTT